ncbi:ribosomal maturation YjgA family protein [Scytonema sp. NUACC21]
MLSKKPPNLYILSSLLIVVAMGFFFKYYVGPAHQWVNNYGAAVFYEIFWCLFAFLFFRNQAAVWQIPLWVFLITCILEFLQLWHPPLLEEFRATLIGKWLIGTTFAWWDFPHYLLGCLLGWLWLQKIPGKNYAKKSQS